MAVDALDILFKLSNPGSAQGDTDPGTPNDSLGGYISITEVVSGTLHNLFDVITGQQNIDQIVDYRCIFVHNSHETDTLFDTRVFVQSEVAEGATVHIGLDPAGITALGSVAAQAEIIVDEETAPAGVAFTKPVDFENGLVIGDIDAGEVAAIWIRRTAQDTPGVENDGAVLRVQGETI